MNEGSSTLFPDTFENDARPSGLAELRARVRRRANDFAPAAQRVCQVLAALTPEELLYLTAAELGQQTRTSNATVVRTLQALGYEGLGDLKSAIANSATDSRSSTKARYRIETTGANLDTVWQKVTDEAQLRLKAIQESYDSEKFNRAVELLSGAKSVATLGFGTNTVVAENLARQLVRIGVSARHLSGSGFQLVDLMLTIERGMVLVLLVPRRLYPELEAMIDQVHAVGAQTILITHEVDESFDGPVAVRLHAPNTPTGITSQPLGPFIVADALVQGVAALDGERTVQTLHTFGMLRRRLGF